MGAARRAHRGLAKDNRQPTPTEHLDMKPYRPYRNPRLTPSDEVERVLATLRAVDLSAPLTPEEQAEFAASKAREMARAELRRLPSPQGLLEV